MSIDQANLIVRDKVCSRCGLPKPLSQFRRMRRGQERRHAECNECRSIGDRLRADRKRRRRFSMSLTQILGTKRPSRTEALAKMVIASFGGADRFGQSLSQWLIDSAPGSPFRAKVQLAAWRMVEAAELEGAQRRERELKNAATLTEVSANPLACYFCVRILLDALRRDPKPIQTLLRNGGWRLLRQNSSAPNR